MADIRLTKTVKEVLWISVMPVLVVVIWWISAGILDSAVFPSPLESLQRLSEDIRGPHFMDATVSTLRLLIAGWLMAVVAGTLIGFMLGQSRFWARVFETPLFAFYSVPFVTIYPVFLLFFGITDTSLLLFAFIHGVFPIALLVMGATANMEKIYLKMADALVLSWFQRLRLILVPAILPAIVTALRLAFGLTLLGLLLGEMFASPTGLGRLLVENVERVQVDRIAGQVVFIALIAVVPAFALRWMEQRTTAKYKGINS